MSTSIARRGVGLGLALMLCSLLSPSLAATPVIPHRERLLPAVGMVVAEDERVLSRGSGAVAGDPRLVFGCAHVLFDEGHWLTDMSFAPGWHAAREPALSERKRLRGAFHFESYAALDAQLGGNAPETFAFDFAVMYSFEPLGVAPLPVMPGDTAAAITGSNDLKVILGYPFHVDATGEAGEGFQYVTGPFTVAGEQVFDSYYLLPEVTSGQGNSGGPLLIGSQFAGVLVSGSIDAVGINLLDDGARNLAAKAAGRAKVSLQTRSIQQRLVLPDNDRRFQERQVKVSLKGKIASLEASVDIRTPYQGDLDVYLISPGGRIRWLNRHSVLCCRGHFQAKAMDLSSTYAGVPAAGTWRLRMRDAQAGDRATFRAFSLSLAAGR